MSKYEESLAKYFGGANENTYTKNNGINYTWDAKSFNVMKGGEPIEKIERQQKMRMKTAMENVNLEIKMVKRKLIRLLYDVTYELIDLDNDASIKSSLESLESKLKELEKKREKLKKKADLKKEEKREKYESLQNEYILTMADIKENKSIESISRLDEIRTEMLLIHEYTIDETEIEEGENIQVGDSIELDAIDMNDDIGENKEEAKEEAKEEEKMEKNKLI